MPPDKKFILASRSPRRRQLLKQIGMEFEIIESFVEEDFDPAHSPEESVKRLSYKKAEAVGKNFEEAIVIGADTIVVLEGRILGKPRDRQEAAEMLSALSGRTHQVYTGFTILDRPSDISFTDAEVTSVSFRKLSEEEIAEYVSSDSPMDKAGAYGIQDDRGAVFVEKIVGCYYNVVGFPLTRFYVALNNFRKQIGVR